MHSWKPYHRCVTCAKEAIQTAHIGRTLTANNHAYYLLDIIVDICFQKTSPGKVLVKRLHMLRYSHVDKLDRIVPPQVTNVVILKGNRCA